MKNQYNIRTIQYSKQYPF